DLNVNSSGTFELSNPNFASNLSMKADKAINVNSGGTFTSIGSSTFNNLVTNATGYTAFNVNSGGTIGAVYTILEKMNTFGVNVKDGAFVDLANPLSHCVFREGIADGTLLTIDNYQTILVEEADFPPNTWSGGPNVSKNLDQGMVTFQNATGMWSGEMYDYDPFNRILWTSTYLPDLVITNAFWSDTEPLVGDLVTLTVTVSNLGVTGLTVPQVYLDFYYNMASPPTWGMLGNQYQSIASLPPGESQTLYFDVQYFTPGLWTSWLQIDTDYFQEELNEDNNVYGPIYLTWMPLALPAIADLSIEIAPGTYYKRLNWTYPQAVSHFNIYRSSDPFFTPSLATFIANVTYPTMQYVDTTTADKYFYIVTAEQVAAALQNPEPSHNQTNPQRRNE
ncbi:MAG: CARDB domain-containing protein, partial [Candidatus Cloacimonadaceae bacterium]